MSESLRRIEFLSAAIDLTLPYVTPVIFNKITSNVGTDTQEIDIGEKDFWVTNIVVRAYDDAGEINPMKPTGSLVDKFSIRIKSNDTTLFSSDPMDIYSLNELGKTLLNKGWVMKNRGRYSFEVIGQGIPSSAKFTTFIKFEIDLMGYKLSLGN